MIFDIVMWVMLVVLYIITIYAGHNRANNKLNNDELYAAKWETIERISLSFLFVTLFMYALSTKFDVVIYYMKEILEKLEVLTAYG